MELYLRKIYRIITKLSLIKEVDFGIYYELNFLLKKEHKKYSSLLYDNLILRYIL